MNNLKNKRFLSLIIPVLKTLKDDCFDPVEHPNRACPHCSLNCGRDRHDPDCEYQLGVDIITEIEQINESSEYDLNYRKQARAPEEIQEIKESAIVRVILEHLKPHLSSFISLDYSDPDNEGTVCSCSIFETERRHDPNCPNVAIGLALSELFKP